MDTPRGASAALDVAAAVGLVLETLLVATIGVGYAVYALLGGIASGLGWALAAFGITMAASLAVLTRGWVRRKRYALGGVLSWQLMQVAVAVWLWPARPTWAAALLGVAVVVGAAAVRRYGAAARSAPPAGS